MCALQILFNSSYDATVISFATGIYGDGEVAASLERIRDADGKSKRHEPRPRWRLGSLERAQAV